MFFKLFDPQCPPFDVDASSVTLNLLYIWYMIMSNQPVGDTTPPEVPAPIIAHPKYPSKSPSKSPSRSPPAQGELGPADDSDHDSHGDADSSIGSDSESSTASVSASILEYRRSQGRTYHSDKFTANYFFPNDDQQVQSMDLTHHYLTLLLDGELFLAPLKIDSIQRVLDVGTGSGIWAIEFADRYPNTEVVGTDLSPCQPQWVPPNLRFEIDDATQPWTWKEDYFSFIHIRYLFGAVKDWHGLFREAYRCCALGGWVQSGEADVTFRSDDGTTELEPVFKTYQKLFEDGSQILGNPFFVHDLQQKAFEEAGFTDVETVDYKFPIGGWPKDPKLAEVGRFVKATLENDLEGYTLMMWQDVCKWPKDEYQVFLMSLRKAIRNPKVHSYMTVRYVYGRK